MVEMAPSSSKPHFTFLIYFPSHLSQCVDCIIVSVTESHASIINDSAGSKPEPHRLSQIFASPPTSVPATVGPSVFVLTALRQMPYAIAPCWTESFSFQVCCSIKIINFSFLNWPVGMSLLLHSSCITKYQLAMVLFCIYCDMSCD